MSADDYDLGTAGCGGSAANPDPPLELSVQIIGEGDPATIFLHGFGEGGYIWEGVADTLRARGRAVVPDLRGHGESPWDPEGDYSVHAHARDVVAIIDRLALSRYVIIGHSMGGAIGLRLASRRCDGLMGLVLADFGPTPAQHGIEQIRTEFRRSERTFPSTAAYAALMAETRPLVHADRLAAFADRALRPRPGGDYQLRRDPAMLRARAGSRPSGQLETLASVRCPVLVVRGAFSSILSPATATAMAQATPRGRTVTVPMAGHGLVADNPAGFVAAVAPFLAGIDAEGWSPR